MERAIRIPEALGVPAILIVDDNPADRRLILEALADLRTQIAVEEITTGHAAVRRAEALGRDPEACVPDLLIVDLHLPCVSGIEVLRAFRANPLSAELPALFLTGSASPTDRAAIGEIPGAHFLEKPEDLDAMAVVGQTIRALLASGAPKRAPALQ